MLLLLGFLFGAMLISFLCSVLEATLMSTPISYITMKEDEGDRNYILHQSENAYTKMLLDAVPSLGGVRYV